MSFKIDLSFIQIDEELYCGSETSKQAKLRIKESDKNEQNKESSIRLDQNCNSIFNEFNNVLEDKIKKLNEAEELPQIIKQNVIIRNQTETPNPQKLKKQLIEPLKPFFPLNRS
jgi:hypothetical protein